MAAGIADLLRQAVDLHRQGQIARAAALYQEILQRQPGHFDALHLLGVACLQSGDPEAAVTLIGQAIRVNPRSADALTNLGNALRERGRHAQALTCYDRALGIRPDSAEAHYNRALTLQELQRHDDAVAGYERARAAARIHRGALQPRRGVAPERLVFAPRVAAGAHLAHHRRGCATSGPASRTAVTPVRSSPRIGFDAILNPAISPFGNAVGVAKRPPRSA
ncbi:MAG: tetratricopeptide repeat protein [Porticoccaceae bacterium]